MTEKIQETNSDDEIWEYFKDILKTSILKISFQKSDGSTRIMKCTMKPSVLENYDFKKKTTEGSGSQNPNIQIVWDLEKDSWRSVKKGTLISVEVDEV